MPGGVGEILALDAAGPEPVGPRPLEVTLAASLELAARRGEAHVYLLRFEAGGSIGPHEAQFGQLLVVLSGSGGVAGADGARRPLGHGEAGFVRRGEIDAKGATPA